MGPADLDDLARGRRKPASAGRKPAAGRKPSRSRPATVNRQATPPKPAPKRGQSRRQAGTDPAS